MVMNEMMRTLATRGPLAAPTGVPIASALIEPSGARRQSYPFRLIRPHPAQTGFGLPGRRPVGRFRFRHTALPSRGGIGIPHILKCGISSRLDLVQKARGHLGFF